MRLVAAFIAMTLASVVVASSCDTADVLLVSGDATRFTPNARMVKLYDATHACLDSLGLVKERGDIDGVRWWRAETLILNGKFALATWDENRNVHVENAVVRVLLNEAGKDTLRIPEDLAGYVVRHEAVHDIARSFRHVGPEWACAYYLR